MIRLKSTDLLMAVCAMGLSAFGAWAAAKYGLRLGLVDKPNERSSHSVPTPRGGGVGIMLSIVLASWFVAENPFLAWTVLFMGVLGFAADIVPISSHWRLLLQLLFCAAFVLYRQGVPETAWLGMIFIFLVLSIAWTANVFNFMDGVNGIAGVTAVVGFLQIAVFSLTVRQDPRVAALCFCTALAALGFLPFNVPSAKVFMGDVGSVTLGFLFAALTVWLSRTMVDFLVLVSCLAPFYGDELLTMMVRIRNRENLLLPHRKHIYQLLANELEWPHGKVCILYGSIQATVGFTILLARPFDAIMVGILLAVYTGAAVCANVWVRRAAMIK